MSAPIQINIAKSPNDLDFVLGKIAPTLEANDSGSTTFKNIDLFEALLSVLCGYISVPDHWHTDEMVGVIRRGVLDANREGKLNRDDLAIFINRAASNLVKREQEAYRCWAKISISGPATKEVYRYKLREGTIYLRKNLPLALRLDDYFISGIGHISPDKPEGGAYVIAAGEFRSATQAGSSLSSMMHDFAGTLTYTQIRFRRFFRSGKLRPKAQVMLGDNFYLFQKRKHLTEDHLWYDSNFREDFWQSCRYDFKKLEKSDKFLRYFLASMNNAVSSDILWRSFRVATRAWMSHDLDERLSQLWSAFEILFSRSDRKTDSYEQTVRRASFFSRDRRLARLILMQAGDARNHYLHRRASAPAVSYLADWLSNYYAGVIEWIVFSSIRFESHSRLLDMSELSTDAVVLEEQIKDRRLALKVVNRN
jgi:hypothetical protein